MNLFNKFLSYTLFGAILLTACFAVSLTEIHASVTISFGKNKSEVDPKVAALAYMLPDSIVRRY